MANSPLQKSPLGLLGAFNLKTLGMQPSGFGDTVVPTVDVTGLYERDLLHVVGADQTSAGAQSFSATVPSGVTWHVYAMSAFVTVASADQALDTYIRVNPVIGGSALGAVDQYYAPTGGVQPDARQRNLALWLPVPVLLLPGDAVQCVVDTVPTSGGLTNTQSSLRVLAAVIPS